MNNDVMNNLFYFVFGITQEDTTDKKKQTCARKAYLDLCRTLTYNKKSNEKSSPKTRILELVRNQICECISEYPRHPAFLQEYIVKMPMARVEFDNEFDKWHYCLSTFIIDEFNNSDILDSKKAFTYGHAQKWINMTIKYMRIMDILPKTFVEASIHIPVDQYILNAAMIPKEQCIIESQDVCGLGIKSKIDKWSKIDNYEEYYEFQKNVRRQVKNETPVKWEEKAWIAEAICVGNSENRSV